MKYKRDHDIKNTAILSSQRLIFHLSSYFCKCEKHTLFIKGYFNFTYYNPDMQICSLEGCSDLFVTIVPLGNLTKWLIPHTISCNQKS